MNIQEAISKRIRGSGLKTTSRVLEGRERECGVREGSGPQVALLQRPGVRCRAGGPRCQVDHRHVARRVTIT